MAINNPGGSGGAALIEEIIAVGGETVLTIDNIPATFKALNIVVFGIANNNSSLASSFVFNSDTASVYDYNAIYSNGSIIVQNGNSFQGPTLPNASFTDAIMGADITILNYLDDNFKCLVGNYIQVKDYGQITDNFAYALGGHWRNTAPITRIDWGATQPFGAGTTFRLYGI